jgi:hypothetical protein
MKTLLIEDDNNGIIRARNTCSEIDKTIYNDNSLIIDWVKTYSEFVYYINNVGIPDILLFDHDLGTDNYELWHKHNGYIDNDINYEEYKTKTGYHCLQYLIDYCIDNKILLTSKIYSHSLNTKGKENILKLAQNFKKHQEQNGTN